MTFYQMAGFPLLYFVSTLELSFGRTSNLMVRAVPNGHLGLQFFILIFQPLGILKQQLYTLFMLSLPFLHLCLQGVESFVNGCRLSVSSSSRRQICHFYFYCDAFLIIPIDDANCWYMINNNLIQITLST